MTRPLHEMSRAEIAALLGKDTAFPAARRFVMDLFDGCADPAEIPALLADVSLLAQALNDKSADFDPMSLSFRELGPLLGYGTELPVIRGIDPARYDVPLRDFGMGLHEFKYRVRKFGEQLDAEHAKRCAGLAQRFAFPD